MNTPYTATHCFYQPSDHTIIDTCTDEDPPRGHYSGLTLEEIRVRGNNPYPGAVIMLFDEAIKAKEDACKEPVSEITEEKFWYFLEVLPPQGWKQETGRESFKMSEHFSGNITGIYARIGKRYFALQDDCRLPHDEIVRRCEEYIKNNPEGDKS